EQNTREAIFAALRRREVFATSGTRLRVRFFAGWHYERALFKNKEWARSAYKKGVPMGAALRAGGHKQSAPTFVAWAEKDPAGANLDRLQIIKVRLKNGHAVERIYDVALSNGREVDPITGKAPAVGSTVDAKTATYTNAIGARELSAVWKDPE